jgi:hypothetical protein
MGVLKLDGSGLPEVRLIYMYAKLRAPSLICLPLRIRCPQRTEEEEEEEEEDMKPSVL